MVEIDRDVANQQIFRFGVSRNGPVISAPPAKRDLAADNQTGRRDHRHPTLGSRRASRPGPGSEIGAIQLGQVFRLRRRQIGPSRYRTSP